MGVFLINTFQKDTHTSLFVSFICFINIDTKYVWCTKMSIILLWLDIF